MAVLTAAGLCLTGTLPANAARPYFFPYVNPYEATVMEVPPPYQAKLPKYVPTRVYTLKIFPDRRIPDLFWYEKGLAFSLAAQARTAPLIFIIAGTGARFDSPKMRDLQRIFYQAGFHVLSLSSPTHMDFVINASSTMVPGHLADDARDLYRVMARAWEKVKGDVEASGFFLTGYSLGGSQAAFVTLLDERQQQFGFRKVLLINPPLDLVSSVAILDRLVAENIPSGPAYFGALFEVMEKFADVYPDLGYTEFSREHLYRVYKRFPPDEDLLEALVGLAFRLDLASMFFTSDVMTGGGYIVPQQPNFTSTTPLTPYAMVSFRTSFADYLDEYFLPFFRRRNPHLTDGEILAAQSLRSIEGYLRRAEKIALLHNEDDIILAPAEIGTLAEIFGERAKIYPTGGHCGNLIDPDVVRFIQDYFAGGVP